MKRDRIYFVTNGLNGGGAERVMTVIANHLDKHGFNVCFIMLQLVPEAYNLNDGIKRYYRKKRKRKDIIGDILFIRSFAKKSDNSIFISFFTYQSICTIIAALGTAARVIVSERNDPKKTVQSLFGRIIRSTLYGSDKCESVVFQTNGAKDCFGKNIQKKGIIILNPLNKEIPYAEKEVREKRIVSVGRLTAQKNYPLLLNSFSRFCEKHSDYKLEIYGKGELKAKLQETCKELGIEEKVCFEGFVNNIYDRIKNASMFVISSDYEGLSNALLEAMAMGLPCISTDSPPGGARMVIKNGINGILVPIGDSDALTKSMCLLAEDDDLRVKISKNAVEIRERLDENRICQEWEMIL